MHLDLLCSMDTDSFLFALWPEERNHMKSFVTKALFLWRKNKKRAALEPSLKEQLAEQSINFNLIHHLFHTWVVHCKGTLNLAQEQAGAQLLLSESVKPQKRTQIKSNRKQFTLWDLT